MRVVAAIVGAILWISIAQGAVGADTTDERVDFQDVTAAAIKVTALKTLNEGLQRIGRDAKIRDCSILLWSRAGHTEVIFGGVCELQTRRRVVLCGDTGVGEFSLAEAFSPTRDGIAEFIRNNCPGG